MNIRVTIKLSAETRDELINTFASEFELARVHFEELRTEGIFGPPEKVSVNFLVVGGKYGSL